MSATDDGQTLQTAHSLRRSGRLSEAAGLYRQLVNKDSDNFHALHFLGVTEAATGNFAQAKQLLARSLSIEPPNIQFVENYATILFQAGDYKSALDSSHAGLQFNNSSITLLYVNALALFKLDRLQESLAQFDQLLLLQPKHVAALNERAAVLAGMNRYDEALASIESALAVDPRYVQAHLNKAVLYSRRARYGEAVAAYDQALELNPDLANAWLGRGDALCALRRFDEAAAAYDKALALHPNFANAWLGRGHALCELGRHEDSLAAYAKALELNPDLANAWIGRANILAGLGRHDESLSAYDQALASKPDLAHAWFGRGHVFGELKRHHEALAAYARALELNPDLAHAWLGRGDVLFGLGRHDESLTAYDQALALKPELAHAWLGRGNILGELKRHDQSLAAYDKALALNPGLAEAWLGRGNVFRDAGRHDESLAAYDRALALKPGLADAWLGRGNFFYERGRYDESLAAYDRALALTPDLANAWLGRGNVFCELGRHDEALAAHDRALALKPDLAEAWLGRGNVLDKIRHLDESLAAYDRALALKPNLAKAWLGRGNAFCEFRRYDESLAAYDRALALKPDLAAAWFGSGQTHCKTGRYDDALAAHDRALALEPDLAEAWVGRAIALLEINRATDALTSVDKALAIKPDFRQALSHRIFVLDFADGVGIEEQQQARNKWWREGGAKFAEQSRARHLNSRDPDRPIKLGYVSADFRTHSAALFFKPILFNHDKTRFEVTCYSSSNVEDDYTEDFRRAADRWRNVAQLSDDEFDERIQADQIDILVDLSGHTAGHRLDVFARKPAPVQVSAGATGTGLPTIDYLFSDPVICPAASRHLFAEKIVDLPCVITIEPLPEQLRPSDPPVLAKGHVTFGVFNRATKISEDVVSLWSRILHSVPRSRILMKHYGFDQAAMRSRLLEKFAGHGISADRVAFLGATSRGDHLAAFKDVDISLDPFPHNGGISTWESLQMGVPVVAMLGKTVSSRSAGAILSSVGMKDWVAEKADDYLAVAVKFASAPNHLKALRHELPARLSASAAGNSALYTQAIETAYRKMWADYCQAAA